MSMRFLLLTTFSESLNENLRIYIDMDYMKDRVDVFSLTTSSQVPVKYMENKEATVKDGYLICILQYKEHAIVPDKGDSPVYTYNPADLFLMKIDIPLELTSSK